jgi:hypothetical protein
MLITKAAAAKIISVSKVRFQEIEKQKPLPKFFVKTKAKSSGRIILKIDDQHKSWKKLVKEKAITQPVRDIKNKKRSDKQKRNNGKKSDEDLSDKEIDTLAKRSAIATLEKEISLAVIAAEKAKQEEIKTLEQQKDLAPIDMMKHFFSFLESMVNQMFRKSHEMSPKLKAMYLSGEDKKAEDLIKKEIQSVANETRAELLKELKSAGYGKR